MKKIFLFLLFVSLFMFGCDRKTQKKTDVDPKAIELTNLAIDLFRNYQRDSLIKAITLLDEAISIDCTSEAAYYLKVQFLDKSGQIPLALNTLSYIIQNIDSENPQYYLKQGMLNEKLGNIYIANAKYKKAILKFDEKIKDEPNKLSWQVDRVLAQIMIDNDNESAIKELIRIQDKLEGNNLKPYDKQYLQMLIKSFSEFNRYEIIENG